MESIYVRSSEEEQEESDRASIYSDQVDPDIEERLYSIIHHANHIDDIDDLDKSNYSLCKKSYLSKSSICDDSDVRNCFSFTETLLNLCAKTDKSTHNVEKQKCPKTDLKDFNGLKSSTPIVNNAKNGYNHSKTIQLFNGYFASDVNMSDEIVTVFDSSDDDEESRARCQKSRTSNPSVRATKQLSPELIELSSSDNSSRASEMNSVIELDSCLESSSSSSCFSSSSEESFSLSSDFGEGCSLSLANVSGHNEGISKISLTEKQKSFFFDDAVECLRVGDPSLTVDRLDGIPGDKRSFRRVKLDPGEDPDLWKIDIKDRLNSSNKSRYFLNQKYCGHCNKLGNHPTKLCPQIKNGGVCCICAANWHMSSSCPNRSCTKCMQSGHCNYSCNASSKVCRLCAESGHIEKVCTSHWRKYSLVTDISEITPASFEQELKKKNLSCSHCAGKHNFFECNERKQNRANIYQQLAMSKQERRRENLKKRRKNSSPNKGANQWINKQAKANRNKSNKSNESNCHKNTNKAKRDKKSEGKVININNVTLNILTKKQRKEIVKLKQEANKKAKNSRNGKNRSFDESKKFKHRKHKNRSNKAC